MGFRAMTKGRFGGARTIGCAAALPKSGQVAVRMGSDVLSILGAGVERVTVFVGSGADAGKIRISAADAADASDPASRPLCAAGRSTSRTVFLSKRQCGVKPGLNANMTPTPHREVGPGMPGMIEITLPTAWLAGGAEGSE